MYYVKKKSSIMMLYSSQRSLLSKMKERAKSLCNLSLVRKQARFVLKYRHCDAKLSLRVTDDVKVCSA